MGNCSDCGGAVGESSFFCSSCGAAQSPPSFSQSPRSVAPSSVFPPRSVAPLSPSPVSDPPSFAPRLVPAVIVPNGDAPVGVVPVFEGDAASSAPPSAFSYNAPAKAPIHYHNFNYPSQYRRLGAYVLDMFIMSIFLVPVGLLLFWRMPMRTSPHPLGGDGSPMVTSFDMRNFIIVITLLCLGWIIYFLQGDGGRGQGTLGKRLIGFKLVDELGGPLSSNKVLARSALKLVCIFTVVGALPIWGPKHQTFYDRVTHTVCVMQL